MREAVRVEIRKVIDGCLSGVGKGKRTNGTRLKVQGMGRQWNGKRRDAGALKDT
jgi:hypothetical protein